MHLENAPFGVCCLQDISQIQNNDGTLHVIIQVVVVVVVDV